MQLLKRGVDLFVTYGSESLVYTVYSELPANAYRKALMEYLADFPVIKRFVIAEAVAINTKKAVQRVIASSESGRNVYSQVTTQLSDMQLNILNTLRQVNLQQDSDRRNALAFSGSEEGDFDSPSGTRPGKN